MKIGALDSLKISTTHFRIGFLVLNLILTVLIGAQALFAVFQKPEFPKLTRWPDPEELKDTGGIKSQTDGLVAKAVQISRGLGDKVPPPPPPGDGTKPPTVEEVTSGDPDLLPPGPLNDGWELGMCMVTDDPLANFCVLTKKDPNSASAGGAKAGPTGPKISSRVVRPPVRVPGAKTARVPGQAAPTDSKLLKVKGHWEDEDLKINIWVVDIKMNRMVYEDASDGKWRQFALVKKTSSIYTTAKDGTTSLKKVEEPVDPSNPDPKPEKHFHPEPIDPDALFEKRKESALSASAAAAKAGGPGAPRPTNPPVRPPSTDELKKAGQTMGELKNNEKFKKDLKKLSEKDRRMLETLGGAKK